MVKLGGNPLILCLVESVKLVVELGGQIVKLGGNPLRLCLVELVAFGG